MKKILIGLFLLIWLVFTPNKASGATNFSTDYFVTYNVLPSATTHVTVNATLTNLSSEYYASSYKIQLGFKDIGNLKAFDSEGQIAPIIVKNNRGSSIELTFNKRSIGLGKKLDFNLSFDTQEIAENQGKIWEINIPGLSLQNDFATFNATVITPQSLGTPAYIKPSVDPNISGNNLSFSKDQLGTSGISIAYGNSQIYNFDLTYHLENNNLFPVTTEIALPPTTNYQDVSYESIEPKPQNVTIDKDGNWLAKYLLTPSQKLNVKAKGNAKLLLNPKKEPLTTEQFKEYLKQKPYWESTDPKLKEIAKNLKTPLSIYEYVVDNLEYDFSRVTKKEERLGAVSVLTNPNSAVCLEFTDLFVALSRAAGIPAREVNGYAFTKNTEERPLSLVEDILHAWPEYYDSSKQAWIMVDPTWGNTTGGIDYFHTLDFDHFAFVIKGFDSGYPVPAGGYKTSSNKKTKDVIVSLGSNFNPVSSLSAEIDIPNTVYTSLPMKGEVKIKNTGTAISSPQELFISSSYLTEDKTVILAKIPPLGYTTIPINFLSQSILTNKTDVFKIQIGDYSLDKKVKITPIFLNFWIILEGVLIVGFCITLSIIIAKSRRLPFFRKT
ncbi:MAG: transglutaminase family protein [Candidatus Levyibacteriota bacterium]